ncbi:HAMP domain-containing histidine kinase [Streptomyces sp. RG38]|uniref:histidine kinase n=1 Tax=Streptomyces tagetis TaxID=2820809 RepID=A0A940XE34_9ACTN|nr:HAMP domain-containing histidine kinase [Streptomyces sp. RG38]
MILSHLAVLLIAQAAMGAARAIVEGPAKGYLDPAAQIHRQDGPIDSDLALGLGLGTAAAFLAAVVLSRFLLRPLDNVRSATHRLAEGHYDDVLTVPSEPGLAALVQDVNSLAATLADTERRRARLVSEIAHEMRTPITILHGQIEGMADGIFTPDDAMFASLADDLDRLRRLASDLSSLSQAEEGAFALRSASTDVAALARATARRLRPQYDDQGITLTVDADTPAVISGDPDRITQVLINLLGNALTASHPGGHVVLSVHGGTGTRTAPRHVTVGVTDDGIGIAEHDLNRIFTRFERIKHPGRPSPAGGSGIGLTIARGIAEAHGGSLTVASPGVGRGSTFTLRLPVTG